MTADYQTNHKQINIQKDENMYEIYENISNITQLQLFYSIRKSRLKTAQQ